MQIPRILIGAAGSGSGKTLLTCALLFALSKRGKKTAAFKCGPDYIDPMFHKEVLSIPSKNLDTFFTEDAVTRALFFDTAKTADISVIEGVMGLYDGLGGIREEGSSYHLAKVTDTPIILVVDARGMGRSILAVIAGFLAYDEKKLIRGVILNRTSKAFFETIKPEIEKSFPISALGYFPKQKDITMESRHLGLKMPKEIAGIYEQLEKCAKVLESTVDLDELSAIAQGAKIWEEQQTADVFFETPKDKEDKDKEDRDKEKEKEKKKKNDGKCVKIGVARDEAFCFYYEDNLKLLERAGAELIFFSPLRDKKLPEGISGLLLGGGYPELYAKALAENVSMKADIREKVKGKLPTLAECGGFMYLHEKLRDMEEKEYEMAGVVKGSCFYTGKLVRFGYVVVSEKEQNFLDGQGSIRGHEFHYFDSTANGSDCVAEKPVSGKNWDCIWDRQSCFFGFPHLYYASNVSFLTGFIKKARQYEKDREL